MSSCRPLFDLFINLFISSTKIAIKMSRSSTKTKEDFVKDDSVSADSESEDENMEDENREETPDLYRNSALGMYAGVS